MRASEVNSRSLSSSAALASGSANPLALRTSFTSAVICGSVSAHNAHAHGAGLSADILAQRIGQLRDVMCFDAGHRLISTRPARGPTHEPAVMRVHEEIGGGPVGARCHEQFRHMVAPAFASGESGSTGLSTSTAPAS